MGNNQKESYCYLQNNDSKGGEVAQLVWVPPEGDQSSVLSLHIQQLPTVQL